MLMEGIVGRLAQKFGNGAAVAPRPTPGLGSISVAQVEGEGDECTRGGLGFRIASSLVAGIAPVQAIPTTTAQWLLYNPAGSDVVVYIDEIGLWLLSGTAGAGGTVLAALCGNAHLPSARPAASIANMVLGNCSPRSKRAAQLVVVSNQALQANPGWSPIAWMNPANTLLGQTQAVNDQIKGRIGLPPDSALALAMVSPVGTAPLFIPTGRFRENSADIE